MRSKPPERTVVGSYNRAFVKECELHGLKRKVCALLAERGVMHQDAAKHAGVSRVYWSRLQSAAQITGRDLETLAKGCGVSRAVLIAACTRPAKRGSK